MSGEKRSSKLYLWGFGWGKHVILGLYTPTGTASIEILPSHHQFGTGFNPHCPSPTTPSPPKVPTYSISAYPFSKNFLDLTEVIIGEKLFYSFLLQISLPLVVLGEPLGCCPCSCWPLLWDVIKCFSSLLNCPDQSHELMECK